VCKNHKFGCFSENLPRCQALSASSLSRITWLLRNLADANYGIFDIPVGMSHSPSMDSLSHFRNAQNERVLVLPQTMSGVNTLSLLSKQVGSEDENSVF
jgi:hypothetical protein